MTTEAAAGAPAAGTEGGQPAGETTQPIASPQAGAGDELSLDTPKPAAPEETTEVVSFEETGDVGLDLALDFVAARGLGPSHPAVKAAEEGDFGPIREALKALGDKAKGYEKYVALAEKSFKEATAQHTERRTKDVAAIEGAVGGKEAWAEVKAWASAQTEDSPSQRAEVNAALKMGGMVAVAMAKHLTHLYNKSGQATQEPASAVQPGATGKPAEQGPLTAKQFAQESQALRAKLGYSFDTSPQYAALQARRLAARAAGH
jgi:hypothetical protein